MVILKYSLHKILESFYLCLRQVNDDWVQEFLTSIANILSSSSLEYPCSNGGAYWDLYYKKLY